MRVDINESRVDWITCYSRNGARADLLEGYARDLVSSEARSGDELSPTSRYGFLGEQTRHVGYGRGPKGVLVRCSGQLAGEHFHHLAILADHVSRLDYCVTGHTDNAKWDPVEAIVRSKSRDDHDHPKMPSVMLHKEIWEGVTAELAQRASAVFGRVYDKHKESNGEYPQGTWRWEIELKRHASEQEHEKARRSPRSRQSILELVSTQFRDWEIGVPWCCDRPAERWKSPARKRDVDATAHWLQSQVGNGARRVAEIYGRDRVLELLGLVDYDDSMKEG